MKEYKNKVKNTLVNYKTNFIFNTLAFSSKLWKIIFSTLLLLPFLGTSQTITISNPTINFTQACGSSSFNTFNFSFSFFPVSNLGVNNEFIVELSDATGNFLNPTIIKTLTNNTTPVSSNFNLPPETYGENYRIRVRSTNPARTSNPSNIFPAYYAIHNQPYSINSNIGTVFLCSGETYELSVDNTGNSNSPFFYPNLNYIWYKDYEEIIGENGPTITVSEPGSYYSIVDYGSCVMNSYSNMVRFQFDPELNPVISSSNSFLCHNELVTLTTNIQGANYLYKWYKDNVEITSATDTSYTVTSEGVYHLSIGSNGCFYDSNFITIDDYNFSISIDNPSPLVILPGESKILTSQNNAQNAVLQWDFNGNAITGATTETLEINTIGNYSITATETAPCNITNTAAIEVVFPSIFNASISTTSDYVACDSSSTTLNLSSFETFINNNSIDLLASSSIYSYQWYKNNQLIPNANQSSLTLSSAIDNGIYKLAISYPNLTTIYSNEITVALSIDNVQIVKDRELCSGSSVILSASISDNAYSYQWYLNGTAIINATNPTFTASDEGNYQVAVSSGGCTASSNLLSLEINRIAILSNSSPNIIIAPGQFETLEVVTSATNPQFTWYIDNTLIGNANESTLIVSTPGTYKVVVTENNTCSSEIEFIFNVAFPSNFTVTITSGNYTSCQNIPVTLSLDSLTTIINNNIITLTSNSNFIYRWFKDNVEIPNTSSESITLSTASENGNYYLSVEIPGIGTKISNSIAIEISDFSSLLITPNGPLCNSTYEVTISSSITNPAYNYQWLRNNQVIAGGNSPNLNVNSEGIYYLVITSGNCSVTSNPVSFAFGVLDVISSSNSVTTLIPGENVNLFINTNAVNPTYIWYLNDILEPTWTSSSITVNNPGNYKVKVIQQDECNTEIEMTFAVVYPSNFNANIVVENSYIPCQNNPVTLQLSDLTTLINSQTTTIPSSSSVSFQWFKDGVAISGANSEFLNINSDNQNGSYLLEVTINGIGTTQSNAIVISLFTTSTPVITSSGFLCPNSNVTLSSSVNNPNYSYQWYLNGNEIAGANAPTLTTNDDGNYTIKVSLGNCEISSSNFSLFLYDFTITPQSTLQNVILYGENKNLSITTTAVNPQIRWYQNNVLLPNENNHTYNASEAGTYKVVVEQTENCVFTKEISFELVYPNQIEATISTTNDYQSCISTSTTLNLDSFIAFSSYGDFNLLNNTFNYNYQWLKDGIPLADIDLTSLTLNEFSQNGTYNLEIVIPDYGTITTNSISILFPAISNLNITADGILCPSNSTVTISSNFNEVGAIYEWYSQSSPSIIGNGATLEVSQAGSYYLVVRYENCTLTSNTVTVNQIYENIITVNQSNTITLNEGDVTSIIANNADAYSWVYNNTIISTSNVVTVSEAGVYTLQATIGNCTITKTFTVIVIENNVESIPNIVTPNNDNLNDFWKLPSRYLSENIEIAIYDNTGKIIFKTLSYRNNWPSETDLISDKNLVYYYIITENNVVTKKGTITVIK